MMKPENTIKLEALVSEVGFGTLLQELSELAYRNGAVISMSEQIKSRNYYHLAVDLEPAIKSAIERGL